ncbi:MAG: HEAT repeat domain-containing protein [Eubacteriales bacterium]|nr:HEAT repeat domain-containing protein [Eubacteriales bacterium]
MSEQGMLEKIHKLEGKHKTAGIIKVMESRHADAEVVCEALNALADVADEDAINEITHYLEHDDPKVRIAACKAGLRVGTDYLNTRVHYQLSQDKDPEVKKAVQEAIDERINHPRESD